MCSTEIRNARAQGLGLNHEGLINKLFLKVFMAVCAAMKFYRNTGARKLLDSSGAKFSDNRIIPYLYANGLSLCYLVGIYYGWVVYVFLRWTQRNFSGCFFSFADNGCDAAATATECSL